MHPNTRPYAFCIFNRTNKCKRTNKKGTYQIESPKWIACLLFCVRAQAFLQFLRYSLLFLPFDLSRCRSSLSLILRADLIQFVSLFVFQQHNFEHYQFSIMHTSFAYLVLFYFMHMHKWMSSRHNMMNNNMQIFFLSRIEIYIFAHRCRFVFDFDFVAISDVRIFLRKLKV